jgi:hypothetical protein
MLVTLYLFLICNLRLSETIVHQISVNDKGQQNVTHNHNRHQNEEACAEEVHHDIDNESSHQKGDGKTEIRIDQIFFIFIASNHGPSRNARSDQAKQTNPNNSGDFIRRETVEHQATKGEERDEDDNDRINDPPDQFCIGTVWFLHLSLHFVGDVKERYNQIYWTVQIMSKSIFNKI